MSLSLLAGRTVLTKWYHCSRKTVQSSLWLIAAIKDRLKTLYYSKTGLKRPLKNTHNEGLNDKW